MVDGEHAAGVISIIGGPARLFTVADGTFAHELGALAAGVLRRRDRRAPVAIAAVAPAEDSGLTTSLLLRAAAANTVDEFAASIVHRLDDPAFLGVAVAVFDSDVGTLRFPAALGALTALRGVQTPIDASRVEHLARQRRGVPLPDARHLVPEGWRSLVPALPGTSIALIDRDTAVGRVDIVYDAERTIPHAATRRIEQQAGMIARALSEIVTRVARAPTDHALQSLLTLRRALAVQLHDLTSPIAGIRALSELLIDEPLAPDVRDLVALIQRSAQRALEVTGTLRTLADGDDSHPDPISIAALLTAVLQERAETQRALAITVGSTIDSGMPPIAWPAIAFREWVTSALIASETALVGAARRRIDVRVGLDGAMAMITIADDGVPVGLLPSASEVHGATMSVIRTDDGRTIRRLAIPLTIGTPHHLS
jgi:signal transduction histidine kinase